MPAHPQIARRERLRVLTLNLWHSDDERDVRLRSAGALIDNVRPDVVTLQEVADPPDVNVVRLLANYTGLTVAALSRPARSPLSVSSSTAVLTSLTVRDEGVQRDLPHAGVDCSSAVTAFLTATSGRPIEVTSVHLTHGGAREAARLDQAADLDTLLGTASADDTTVLRVLAGDFNTVPDGDTHRFLTGRTAHKGWSTLWLDAWDTTRPGEDGVTSSPSNPWAVRTALRAGITDPSMLPARRIDYVFVHGWRYGRPGMPLECHVVGTEPICRDRVALLPSDHYAVVTDLWDPPLT